MFYIFKIYDIKSKRQGSPPHASHTINTIHHQRWKLGLKIQGSDRFTALRLEVSENAQRLNLETAVEKMSKKLPSYGSLTRKEDEDPTASQFDASNTYYLKADSARSTSKFLLVAAPLLFAALLMGGIVYFLSRDFHHLYPGRGGDPSYNPNHHGNEKENTVVVQQQPQDHGTAPPMSPSSTSDDDARAASGGACSAHTACQALGLVGECCPTIQGTSLRCCDG